MLVFLLLAIPGCGQRGRPETRARQALEALAHPMEFYLVEQGFRYPDKLEDLRKVSKTGKPYIEKLPEVPMQYEVNNAVSLPVYTISCTGLPSSPLPRLTSAVRVEAAPEPVK